VSKRDPLRGHRVALVRADEAEYLNRNGKNELPSCCPHLECFHSRGTNSEGGWWTACNIVGCGCTTETPNRLAEIYAAQDAAWDRQLVRNAKQAWFMAGMALVGIVGAIHEVLR
jgi:hypothetical protein